MPYKIDQRGAEFISSWESFVPYVYDDKAIPVRVNGKKAPPEYKSGTCIGTLTIGYGHTDAAAHPLKVSDCIGKRLTQAQAIEILGVDLEECIKSVNKLVKVPISQGQVNACVSIVFNMGSTNFRNSSLLKKLNAGDYTGARAAFDLYIRSGGEVMKGLINRRDAEQKLWDEMEPENVPVPAPDSFEDTPRNIDPAIPTKSMAASSIGNSQIAIAGATVVTTAAKVAEAVTADPTPAKVEKITEVIDRVGNVVIQSSQIINSVPEPTAFKKLLSVSTDPIVLLVCGVLVTALCIYTWCERRRNARLGVF